MKIHAHLTLPWSLKESIRKNDNFFNGILEENIARVFLDWPSEAFSKLVAYSVAEDFIISCRTVFDLAENIEWYAMESNSSCSTNDKDEKWRERHWDSMGFVESTKNVKQFKEYRISKIRHVNKKIVSPGGTYFFIPKEVREIFEEQLISGMGWGNIYNLKGDIKYENYDLLVPNSLLGLSEKNLSMEYKYGKNFIDRDYLIPHAGVRSFSENVLKDAKDINLTVEPMSGYNVGSVIVSRRVKEIIDREKIKGVYFEPVLISETLLYKKFLEQWSLFESEIKSANPNNRIN